MRLVTDLDDVTSMYGAMDSKGVFQLLTDPLEAVTRSPSVIWADGAGTLAGWSVLRYRETGESFNCGQFRRAQLRSVEPDYVDGQGLGWSSVAMAAALVRQGYQYLKLVHAGPANLVIRVPDHLDEDAISRISYWFSAPLASQVSLVSDQDLLTQLMKSQAKGTKVIGAWLMGHAVKFFSAETLPSGEVRWLHQEDRTDLTLERLKKQCLSAVLGRNPPYGRCIESGEPNLYLETLWQKMLDSRRVNTVESIPVICADGVFSLPLPRELLDNFLMLWSQNMETALQKIREKLGWRLDDGEVWLMGDGTELLSVGKGRSRVMTREFLLKETLVGVEGKRMQTANVMSESLYRLNTSLTGASRYELVLQKGAPLPAIVTWERPVMDEDARVVVEELFAGDANSPIRTRRLTVGPLKDVGPLRPLEFRLECQVAGRHNITAINKSTGAAIRILDNASYHGEQYMMTRDAFYQAALNE